MSPAATVSGCDACVSERQSRMAPAQTRAVSAMPTNNAHRTASAHSVKARARSSDSMTAVTSGRPVGPSMRTREGSSLVRPSAVGTSRDVETHFVSSL